MSKRNSQAYSAPIVRPRYRAETEIEEDYGIPRRTLQKLRLVGGGPEYRKFGRSVRYDVLSVEKWIDSLPRGGAGIPSSEVGKVRHEGAVHTEQDVDIYQAAI